MATKAGDGQETRLDDSGRVLLEGVVELSHAYEGA
jgi:hypothetical protein